MIHTNTPEEVRRKQSEILRIKTPLERGMMAIEMYEMGQMALRNRLRAKYPLLSEAELRGEIFRCMYRDRFPVEKMAIIVRGIVEWHQKHP